MTRNQPKKSRHASKPAKAQAPFLLIVGGLALILGAVLFLMTHSASAVQNVSAPRIGQPLGNFTLKDMDGNLVKLSDYQGKVVMVNIWATWCPPCRAEMPDLQAFYNANKDKGFIVLALNAGDSQSAVQSFASSYQISFPLLLDPNASLIKQMGIFDYPTSVLIDRNGIVRNIQVGMYTPDVLAADVNPLLPN